MNVVKELPDVEVSGSLHPRRRVVIIQRNDGNFSLVEQYYYLSEFDGTIISEGWASLTALGIYASVMLAEEAGLSYFTQQNAAY